MNKKKLIIIFFIVFIFIFTSVGLGFITQQVFLGEEVKATTIISLKHPYPNIDITKEFQLTEDIPGSTTGAKIVTPVYKKKPGNLIIEQDVALSTIYTGQLAINLNTDELNVVKGAFIFLWIILIVFVIGSIGVTLRL